MAKKELVGKVISNKMEKTVVVTVENRAAHARYGKPIARTHKFKAHDPENKCKIGDVVRLSECRPLSKEKRWLVVEITSSEAQVEMVDEVPAV